MRFLVINGDDKEKKAMKRIWKYLILGLILIPPINGASSVSDIGKADELFDKGAFQEALKEYELALKEADKPDGQCLHSCWITACSARLQPRPNPRRL